MVYAARFQPRRSNIDKLIIEDANNLDEAVKRGRKYDIDQEILEQELQKYDSKKQFEKMRGSEVKEQVSGMAEWLEWQEKQDLYSKIPKIQEYLTGYASQGRVKEAIDKLPEKAFH